MTRLLLALLPLVPAAAALTSQQRGPEPLEEPAVKQEASHIDLAERNRELEAENAQLRAELEKLRAELAWATEQRYIERQNYQTWLETVAALKPKSVELALPVGLAGVSQEEPASEQEPDPSIVRAGEQVISLRNLFKSEGLFAYDLLEGGRCADGALGPVVFRLLDDRGRLAGSLTADRLRFEAGLAGRSVTMILTRGEERRGGATAPFAERRIPLTGVDPRPWIARVPELFPVSDLGQAVDDGKWDLNALRGRMNELLSRDAAAGCLRFDGLDGVAGELMFGVDFAELNAKGGVVRHLFADTLEVAQLDRGIVLRLFGCVAIKGSEKTPFPGGVHRVFLPRAQAAQWRAARIPGLAPAETPPEE